MAFLSTHFPSAARCLISGGSALASRTRSTSRKGTRTSTPAAIAILSAYSRLWSARPTTTHELYVSWGYNADVFKRTDLHLAQPSLGNDFVLHGVQSQDQKGWTDLFHNSLTTSQYSARIGYFFNAKQDLALELSFEHVRFLVTQDQNVRRSFRD